MAKKTRSTGDTDSVSLEIKITDHQLLYSFGQSSIRDKPPALDELMLVTLWGDVVVPKAKAGRDVQVSISGSDTLGGARRKLIAGNPPPVGELYWGSYRAASVHLPPESIWPIAQLLSLRQLKRVTLELDGPLKGTVPIVGVIMTSRKVVLAQSAAGKRETSNPS